MIYIEVLHKKWEPGIDIGVNDKNFELFMANQYVKLIKDRVDTQVYASKWKELNPRYKAWKELNKLSPKIWEATGELIGNLHVKRNRVVGFDNRKRHKVSKEKYLSIARRLEYGDLKVPARPLFRLVYFYMSKNVSYFYEKYERGNTQ